MIGLRTILSSSLLRRYKREELLRRSHCWPDNMEKQKPRNLTVALVSKSRLGERRTTKFNQQNYQEPFDRRHSTGCRRGSDTGNLINFGKDMLHHKVKPSRKIISDFRSYSENFSLKSVKCLRLGSYAYL